MLYGFVKIIARIAIKIYCRNIQLNKKELLQLNGPLLLAVNHPNSFLDAIILCTLFDRPVYSLARGDAFKNKLYAKILFKLKLLPVYRVSEGVENLEENYKTFDACKAIFRENGIVLIFSEGLCVNEWHLRPLKKGTARLAISSWEEGIPLKVLPVGINYSSFKKLGKNIKLFFGSFITAVDVDTTMGQGKAIQSFNDTLYRQLQSFVFEIGKNNKQQLHRYFYIAQPLSKKLLLFIPAAVGWLLHAPLYYPLKSFVAKKNKGDDHFDSIMTGILFFTYPLYIIILSAIFFAIKIWWLSLTIWFILPFTAWALVHLKKQLD
jgi:1-acyl-sn-glycerol-3-phosphate acyltransferase